MIYKVYIMQSLKSSRYYIGHTNNIEQRLNRHNFGLVRSTKAYRPWKVVYMENLDSKSGACLREMEIKSYKGGIKFKKLLGLWSEK